MPRGLDHVVHAVRDLDAAAELYRSLGFTVGSRNRHPWGTHNYIVQLPGFFIELLTLAEPDKLGDDGFSKLFAAYTRDFLHAARASSLLILESRDAKADEAAFRAAHIAASEVMQFEREGRRPDGSAVKVGFSLAFADDQAGARHSLRHLPAALSGEFLEPGLSKTRQQRHRHCRRRRRCRRSRAASRLHAGICRCRGDARQGWFHHRDPARQIEVTTPAAFLHRYGVTAPDVSRGARLAALRFATKDASLLQGTPEFAGLAGLYAGNAAVIGPQDAMGAVLVFERA